MLLLILCVLCVRVVDVIGIEVVVMCVGIDVDSVVS